MANNPNHMANLKPFKKGNSGGGRPKGSSPKTTLQKLLNKSITHENFLTLRDEKLTICELICLSLIKKAINGDTKAANAIFDRIDGKPIMAQNLPSENKSETPEEAYDLSKLSNEELEQLSQLSAKMGK